MTEECVREVKNENSTFKVPNPVSMLRFLFELCSTLVRVYFLLFPFFGGVVLDSASYCVVLVCSHARRFVVPEV